MDGSPQIPTLTADDVKIIGLMLTEPKDWTRRGFESALRHLEYAHRIDSIDAGMAAFRAITAEEEAATALIRALKQRGYPGAESLRPKDHVHKAAVLPFIAAITKRVSYLKINGVERVALGVSINEEPKRLELVLVLGGNLSGQVARPIPPLNLMITEGKTRKPTDYRRYFLEILEPTGYDDISKYLKNRVNERNRILYASPSGLPKVNALPDDYLRNQKIRVMAIIQAALLIWPYKEVQPFVEEAVGAFGSIVTRLAADKGLSET